MPILGHLFVQNIFQETYLSKTAKNIFWGNHLSKTVQKHLSKTYFGTPIYPKLSKTYFEAFICQNPFLVTYLSKTAQNLFKDFEGYIEKASNLVFC